MLDLDCRPSRGAWRRSGSLCAERPTSPSESPAVSVNNNNTSVNCTPPRCGPPHFVLSVGRRAVKRPLLKLEVVHVQLLREHPARRHGDLRDDTTP